MVVGGVISTRAPVTSAARQQARPAGGSGEGGGGEVTEGLSGSAGQGPRAQGGRHDRSDLLPLEGTAMHRHLAASATPRPTPLTASKCIAAAFLCLVLLACTHAVPCPFRASIPP